MHQRDLIQLQKHYKIDSVPGDSEFKKKKKKSFLLFFLVAIIASNKCQGVDMKM